MLEEIPKKHYEELFTWRSDPLAVRYNPFTHIEKEDFLEIMMNFETDLEFLYFGRDFKWGIIEDSQILAIVGLTSINKMMRTAEINYQVNPNLRGTGIGTKAVKALIDKVFSETDLRKLTAMVADDNIASCKILEKLDFEQEGLLQKHFIINGVETDERVYGLLKE